MCQAVRHQRGNTLILVLGAVATLAILAAAVVALTWNMRHATSMEVSQVKAFNVAEAGMDAGQQALWVSWPLEGMPTPSIDQAAFRGQFPADSYPDPVSGQFIDVRFYDDDDNEANWGIRRDYTYDENENGHIWIESEGATGSRAAKVMALVQKVDYEPTIMGNVVFATTGNMETDGAGNQPVVGLDPPANAATIYCNTYEIKKNTDLEPGVSDPPITGATEETIDQIFPDELLLYLIGVANGAGKEYPTAAAIPADAWSTDPRIIVIDSGGLDLKDAPETDTDPLTGASVWSAAHPGILIVKSGDLNSTGQKKAIFGIVYLNDGLILGGNAEIHGMVIAKTSGWMHGTRCINYNQTVMDYLSKPVRLSVKLVPNTWRELSAN